MKNIRTCNEWGSSLRERRFEIRRNRADNYTSVGEYSNNTGNRLDKKRLASINVGVNTVKRPASANS